MVTLPPNFLCSSSASPSRVVRRARLDRHAAEWRAADNARRSHQVIDRDLAGGSFGAPHQSQLALSRRGLNIPPTLMLAIADEAIE
jgi:Tripartite tricarboxylate transporter family receptor